MIPQGSPGGLGWSGKQATLVGKETQWGREAGQGGECGWEREREEGHT